MQLSRRSLGGQEVNALARQRAAMVRGGVRIADLSDSNPTRHGLLDQQVLEVVARGARHAQSYHPEARGPQPAREALAAHFGGSPDDYWLTASTSAAYAMLLAAVADPGDTVATPAPGYPLLEPLAHLAGVEAVAYPWHYVHPHGWMCDTAALGDLDPASAVRALIAVSPGNPTGAYVDSSTRDALVEHCERCGALLIADEVFAPFALGDERMSSPRAVTERLAGERRVTTCALDGLSKLLCAPQLKVGWIRLSGPAGEVRVLAETLDRICDTFLSVNTPAALALPELLDLAPASVERTRARLAANLAQARAVFGAGPWRVRTVEGGWTVLLDVPAELAEAAGRLACTASAADRGFDTDGGLAADDEADLALYLLREAHLAVHPGWLYDVPGGRTLALSLLPEPSTFAGQLAALHAALGYLVG